VLVYEVESSAAAYTITTELLNVRQEPFALRQHRIKIATRMGFTWIDSGLQRAEDALREADVALSVAKRQPNQLSVAYTPGMGGAAVSLVSLEADLHIALERNEFRLLFQPIVDLHGPASWARRLCCAGGIRWKACWRPRSSLASLRRLESSFR